MSLQYRYEGVLIDMLSLLQQALFRFFTKQEVDLSKFVKYFQNFSKSMKELQNQFHPNKIKLTKYLGKIQQLFQQSNFQNHKNLTVQSFTSNNNVPKKPGINFKYTQKIKLTLDNANMNYMEQNNKIQKDQQDKQQQQGQTFSRSIKKRSQTAGQNRKKLSLTIDHQNYRPMTGKIYSRQKNQRYSRYNVSLHANQNKATLSDKVSDTHLQTNVAESLKERKSLYDQLQSEKSYKKMEVIQFSNIPQYFLQQSYRKKKNRLSRRSFKINKLL